MCRLFGFRSVIRSRVHRSLVSADNAISIQSEFHPDGWGVAWYVGGSPHLIKAANQAFADQLFHRVSGVVSSETVIAHIRRATQGTNLPINAHPFQYGRWIFAHNGNIRGLLEHREKYMELIAPELRRFVLGDTDSEVLFYILLTRMQRRVDLFADRYPALELADAIMETVEDVTRISGPWHHDTNGPSDQTYLSFLITDGDMMMVHQGGKELYYSTHKHECPESGECAKFSHSCLHAAGMGAQVNHFIVSSEPLQGENIWTALAPGQIVAVDHNMRMHTFGQFSLTAAAI